MEEKCSSKGVPRRPASPAKICRSWNPVGMSWNREEPNCTDVFAVGMDTSVNPTAICLEYPARGVCGATHCKADAQPVSSLTAWGRPLFTWIFTNKPRERWRRGIDSVFCVCGSPPSNRIFRSRKSICTRRFLKKSAPNSPSMPQPQAWLNCLKSRARKSLGKAMLARRPLKRSGQKPEMLDLTP